MSSSLPWLERPAQHAADGLLILHHGRGSDEHDLLELAAALDPHRRLHVVTPGGPLRLIGSPGRHWYRVPRVGYPESDTFYAAVDALSAFHDETWRRTGIFPTRTILGGFSMGAVMSYALGLSEHRPAPAGIAAFSGFIPTVDGWAPSIGDRPGLRAFIAHGRRDPVIDIGFAHRARDVLTQGGLDVSYHESGGGHEIDLDHVALCRRWLIDTLRQSPVQEEQHA